MRKPSTTEPGTRKADGRHPVRWLGLMLLLVASGAHALGLGEISVRSYLGQPLQARIALLANTPAELEGVTAALASADHFRLVGLDRMSLSVPLEFTVRADAETPAIEIRSLTPVNDPIMQFVVEVRFSNGRFLKQYTLFLDPPTVASPVPLPSVAPRRVESVPEAPPAERLGVVRTEPQPPSSADTGPARQPSAEMPAEDRPEPTRQAQPAVSSSVEPLLPTTAEAVEDAAAPVSRAKEPPPGPPFGAEPSTDDTGVESGLPIATESVESAEEPEMADEPTEVAVIEEPTEPAVAELNPGSEVTEEPVDTEIVEKPEESEVVEGLPEPEVIEEPTEPEVGEEPAEPEVIEAPTEAEVIEELLKPEVTDLPSEPEVAEEPVETEVAEKPMEAEIIEELSEPEVTELPSEPEVAEEPVETEAVEARYLVDVEELESYGPIERGQTLWGVASQWVEGTDYSVNQAMLAIQRYNPEAFGRNNINLLKRGAILRLPPGQEMARLTVREAMLEAMRQASDYEVIRAGGTPAPRPAPVLADPNPTAAEAGQTAQSPGSSSEYEPEGRLELVPPEEGENRFSEGFGESEGTGQGAGLSEEEKANIEQESAYLEAQRQELEAELVGEPAPLTVEDSGLAELEGRLREERESDSPDEPMVVTPQNPEQDSDGPGFGWWLAVGIVVLLGGAIWGLRRRAQRADEPAEALARDEPDPKDGLPADTSIEEPEGDVSEDTDLPEPAKVAAPDDDMAVELDADDPETQLDLARAYIAMGDGQAARKQLQKVLDHGTEEQTAEAKAMLEEIG